jgi:hypothetical protein
MPVRNGRSVSLLPWTRKAVVPPTLYAQGRTCIFSTCQASRAPTREVRVPAGLCCLPPRRRVQDAGCFAFNGFNGGSYRRKLPSKKGDMENPLNRHLTGGSHVERMIKVRSRWWTAGLLAGILAVPAVAFAQSRPADDGFGGRVVWGQLVGGSLNSHSITVATTAGQKVTVRLTMGTRISMRVDGTVASLAHLWMTHQVTVMVVEAPGNPPVAAFVRLVAHGSESGDNGQGQDGQQGQSGDFQLPGQDN